MRSSFVLATDLLPPLPSLPCYRAAPGSVSLRFLCVRLPITDMGAGTIVLPLCTIVLPRDLCRFVA